MANIILVIAFTGIGFAIMLVTFLLGRKDGRESTRKMTHHIFNVQKATIMELRNELHELKSKR